jgi:2-oxoglutarate ferredoxin oxidoreductase subunit delta
VVAKKSKRKKTERIVIRKDLCKGCGICVAFCPTHVLELGEDEKAAVKHLEACTACGLCEMRCPDLAIEVWTEGGESAEVERAVSPEKGAEGVEQRA